MARLHLRWLTALTDITQGMAAPSCKQNGQIFSLLMWSSFVAKNVNTIAELLYVLQGRIQPYVYNGETVGPKRIWLHNKEYPGLAMTRSFGDEVGSSIGLIADPEIVQARSSHLHDISGVLRIALTWAFHIIRVLLSRKSVSHMLCSTSIFNTRVKLDLIKLVMKSNSIVPLADIMKKNEARHAIED